MQANRSVLTTFAIGTCLVGFGFVVYAPVLLSWMDRIGGRPATGPGDAIPNDMVIIRHSWVMQKADFLYLPLIKFHAWLNNYRMHEYSRGNDGSIDQSIYFPKDVVVRD